ncbi:glycosyl hydrolase family 61-domain-containing protein [Dactylonectria estremocensis]|uniref:lytic cellulose monooxygenase (C4-dehydrogenating) n=1 Tax=Dactylonectria estremocensis TaxID=1079267 RepID=A0A9P9DWG0_9HYPO|nr:glycosyl hydrolase family 61-domain-containing protein [Dactylonectria estremocensis]
MRYSAVSALAMASTVAAHAQVYGVWVNDVDQGDGRSAYIRSPANNSPVKDLTSADIVCNVNGATKVDEFVTAAAGDKLTFEWYHDNRGDDIIAASHQGPVITYIAPYTTGDGTGAIWTKIAEDGYDGSEWAVDKLIAAGGKADFTLPEGLAAGQYLIRQEIIAHHESDTAYNENSARGAQFYPSCVQFEITGSGSDVPDQDFDFNTGYTYSDPGILFNLYGSYTSYEIPGPEVWTGSGSSSGGNTAVASSAAPAATSAAAVTSAPVVATSAAAVSSAAAVTSAAEAVVTTDAPVVAPTPSFSTIVTSAAATVVESEAPVATATSSPGSGTGCSSRRRRRRSHARRHI